MWITVLDPASAEPLPALAEGTQWHEDGSLAEVTLTFRATDVPALGFKRYPLRMVPMPDDTGAGRRPGHGRHGRGGHGRGGRGRGRGRGADGRGGRCSRLRLVRR